MSSPAIGPEASHAATMRQTMSEIASWDIENLVREKTLGSTLSFEEGRSVFAQVIDLAERLASAELQRLPLSALTDLQQQFNSVQAILQQIRNFNVQNTNEPMSLRNRLLQSLRNEFGQFFEKAVPFIAYLNATQSGGEAGRRAEQELSRVLGNAKQAEADLRQTLDAARRAAEEIGITKHAEHFKNEAKEHAEAAAKWLKTTFWLGGITAALCLVAIVIAIVLLIKHPLSGSELIQLSIAKFLLFSVLITATLWSGRNYKAHRHNHVVNKHRQNALSTFESFAKAAETDSQTKSAVLLQATQCIFAPQATGYSDVEDVKNPSTQILEILRTKIDK